MAVPMLVEYLHLFLLVWKEESGGVRRTVVSEERFYSFEERFYSFEASAKHLFLRW
jgi:hypothetical protein